MTVSEDDAFPELLSLIADQFIAIAQSMIDGGGGAMTTNQVVHFASRAVPGSESAGLTIVTEIGKPQTMIASDEVAQRLDALQVELGEGPSLDSLSQSNLIKVDDLAHARDWPTFGARAAALTDIRSMLSARIFLTGQRWASLNFYSKTPYAFTETSAATASIFAAYASLVELNRFHEDKAMHLERALESNREIGVAMGILMAGNLFTRDQAFAHLRKASQDLHIKLRDIANYVATTGALPELP